MMIKTILIVLGAILLATFVAGWLIEWLVGRLLRQEKNEQVIEPISTSLKGVGKLIGWLERFLVLCFIGIGYYQGIGFVLAAKSILRWGEIKSDRDQRFGEYVIVGTLLSFSCALVVGLAMRIVLNLPLR